MLIEIFFFVIYNVRKLLLVSVQILTKLLQVFFPIVALIWCCFDQRLFKVGLKLRSCNLWLTVTELGGVSTWLPLLFVTCMFWCSAILPWPRVTSFPSPLPLVFVTNRDPWQEKLKILMTLVCAHHRNLPELLSEYFQVLRGPLWHFALINLASDPFLQHACPVYNQGRGREPLEFLVDWTQPYIQFLLLRVSLSEGKSVYQWLFLLALVGWRCVDHSQCRLLKTEILLVHYIVCEQSDLFRFCLYFLRLCEMGLQLVVRR